MEPCLDIVSEQLYELRQTNVDGHWYVPRPTLDDIFNKETISNLVAKQNLSTHDNDPAFAISSLPTLVDKIYIKAKITFAILFYLGPKYLRYVIPLNRYADSVSSHIDHRLPLTEETLLSCDFGTNDAGAFQDAQWHFTAPKLQLGISVLDEYPQKAILPVRSVRQRSPLSAEGASGHVREIQIESGHQVEPAYTGRIVRKQFHPHMKNQACEKEVRNLSILSSVRHQNIIPLLSAYSHGESFNLIFPLISHGNLDQLFRDGSPSSLGSQASVVMAVWGLASALRTLHGFTLGSLHLAGSHRDLKPANILVNGGQWLLADFGLSRIVEDQDSSSSIAPVVPGDFIAPEHEDKDFERNLIGRASDIFSFGCMILMLLMFYLDGSQGLERLKTKRRRADAQYTHHFFHDYDKPNPGMPETFDYLACKTSPLSPSLLFLIRKMLEIDKELRPKAAAVDNYLRSLAIHMWSTSIEEGLSKACQSGDTHIPVLIEKIRFQGWCSAAKIKDWESPAFSEAFASVSERDFRTILGDMQELHRLLTGSETRVRKTFDPIRARIDRLLNALDDDRRTSAVGYADCILLGSTEHLWLSQLQKFSAEALDSRTKDKVITRRRVLDLSAAPQKFSNNLQIPLSALESLPPRGTASKVRLRSKQVRETVLAEECSAIAVRRWSHGVPVRLQETAELLAASAKNHSFRVLCCRGYYYDNPKLRSGLLYELPSSPQDSIPEVVTLRELLQNNNSQWLLGDRFRLAHGLALALFELHTVSWLHRNISASNVIFFYYEHINNIDPRSFHFVGFAQSRPDRDSTESDGVTQDSSNEDHYVHPEYLYRKQGFQAQYDYYAFGILLLEIAFWQLFF